MKKSFFSIVLLAGILGLAGCQSLQQFFQKPDITFNRVELEGMSLYDATAIFYFDISNPNPVGATLQNLTYDLSVNQKPVASGSADKNLQIPAKGSETVALPVTINYFDAIDSLVELVTKNEITYDLSGSFNLMGFSLPYSASGTLPLPKLPGISVTKVSVNDLSWAGAALSFALELDNDNPFAVTLNGLKYDFSMGGKPFISGTSKTRTSIPENGKTTLTIPFDVNFIWLGKSAYDVLAGDSANYEINGEMIFNIPEKGEKRFPFSKSGNVVLPR